MHRLGDVNLGIVRQIYNDTVSLIGPVSMAQGTMDNLARIERTRSFLAELIGQREVVDEALIP